MQAALQTIAMLKVKEHSLQLRNKIVNEYQAGKRYEKILMQLSVPISFMKLIIKKWKEQGEVINKPRMGAPRNIAPRAIAKL